MRDDFKELNAAIEAELSSGLAASMGLPDWTYRDLPRMTPEFMRKFKDLVGEENIRWITYASYADGTERGQLLVSPEGMERVRVYNASKATQK